MSACPHSIYLFCELSDKDGYFSTIEDNYNENRGCPLCDLFIPKGKLLKHIEQKHFQFGVECVVRDKAVLSMPCLKTCISQKKRAHFHCPLCLRILSRKEGFKRHIQICNGSLPSVQIDITSKLPSVDDKENWNPNITSKLPSVDDKENWNPNPKNIKHPCRYCAKVFSNVTILRKHTQSVHLKVDGSFPSVCIGVSSGIFMVAYSTHGLIAPIHVQKHVTKQILYCEDNDCQDIMASAVETNPSIECIHLQSVKNAHISQPKHLSLDGLEELFNQKCISSATKSACEELWKASKEKSCLLVASADFDQLGYSCRQKYYSVFANKKEYYCKLNRVRVTYDCNTGFWCCTCPVSGMNKHCVHESLCKWYMLEHQQQCFNDNRHRLADQTSVNTNDHFMMEYFLQHKQIPSEIPQSLLIDNQPVNLIPSEIKCPRCEQLLTINEQKLANAFGVGIVWRGITLTNKVCSSCNLVVRFQEYKSGFHNFNNNTLLSLKLCNYLIKGIKNHVAVERTLKILFDHDNLPVHEIRNGLYHCLALTQYSYDFTCNRCGIFPKIVVGDGNWKNTCLRPVICSTNATSCPDEVDVDHLWMAYVKEIVGRGFYGSTNNPWKVPISYGQVAPWMGSHSRKSVILSNTEHKKGKSMAIAKPGKISPTRNLSHDNILDHLLNLDQTSTPYLKQLCEEFGLDANTNQEDIIKHVTELVLFKDFFPKYYRSIKKCGGGIVHLRCKHGVCVYMKCLLRQESARDYVDALISFAQQPVVIVSDIPSQIALHGEQRYPGMFKPFKGMLFEWSDNNLELEKENNLPKVSIDTASGKAFYSLCDAFHVQSKKKGPSISFRNLRNTNLMINSSVCEQQNSDMAKDRYSFCGMDFVNFMFLSRLSLHLHNEDKNKAFRLKLKRHFSNITFDEYCTAKPQKQDNRVLSEVQNVIIPERKNKNIHEENVVGEKQKLFSTAPQTQENDDIKKAADPSMASDFTSADISVAGIQQQAITGTTFSCSVEKNSREQQQSVTDKVSLEKPFAEPKSIVPSMYTDITELWKSQHKNRIEAVVDNTTFDTIALRSIEKEWLDDKNTKMTHVIPSTVATAWYYVHNDLCQKTLARRIGKVPFVTALHVDGNHWILLAKKTDHCYLYDPNGREGKYRKRVEDGLRLFGKTYNCNLLGKMDSVYVRIHPNQQDGSSCGPLVLIEAQNFFFGFGDTKTDREACRQHRVVIGNILLHATDVTALEWYCVVCNKTKSTGKKINWIKCEGCKRWAHRDCCEEFMSKAKFLCNICM